MLVLLEHYTQPPVSDTNKFESTIMTLNTGGY